MDAQNGVNLTCQSQFQKKFSMGVGQNFVLSGETPGILKSITPESFDSSVQEECISMATPIPQKIQKHILVITLQKCALASTIRL